MQIANSPVMWAACGIPVVLVVVQAVLFAKGAYKAGREIGLTDAQMRHAIKSSAVTSIGPSIVVLSGMLSLLIAVGGPIGWMRLSMIGSVMFESIAAGIGTQAIGVSLGADALTNEALGMALWTMVLCSIGWVLFGTFAANRMDKVQAKVSGSDTKKMTAIAGSAVIGVFTSMVANYISRPVCAAIKGAAAGGAMKAAESCVLGAIIMFIIMTVANKKNIGWLREWSIIITIVCAMAITVAF